MNLAPISNQGEIIRSETVNTSHSKCTRLNYFDFAPFIFVLPYLKILRLRRRFTLSKAQGRYEYNIARWVHMLQLLLERLVYDKIKWRLYYLILCCEYVVPQKIRVALKNKRGTVQGRCELSGSHQTRKALSISTLTCICLRECPSPDKFCTLSGCFRILQYQSANTRGGCVYLNFYHQIWIVLSASICLMTFRPSGRLIIANHIPHARIQRQDAKQKVSKAIPLSTCISTR